jgi:hypothetical protein
LDRRVYAYVFVLVPCNALCAPLTGVAPYMRESYWGVCQSVLDGNLGAVGVSVCVLAECVFVNRCLVTFW